MRKTKDLNKKFRVQGRIRCTKKKRRWSDKLKNTVCGSIGCISVSISSVSWKGSGVSRAHNRIISERGRERKRENVCVRVCGCVKGE